MTQLIGFSKGFFEAYHDIHPRSSPYYEERQKLYELYHHLNVGFIVFGYRMHCTVGVMLKVSAAYSYLRRWLQERSFEDHDWSHRVGGFTVEYAHVCIVAMDQLEPT